MADYRDLAAALGGGYGQDTGGITPDTLATLRNGKKASAADLLGMLKDFGGATLSNLESLGRGGAAAFFGSPVDTANMMRTPTPMGSIPLPANFNLRPSPLPGGSQDILGMMPRGTATRPETAGMEELGGYMSPAFGKVAKPAVMATGRLAGQEINAAMTGQPTRSLLGDITPKPLQLDVYHGTPHTLPPTERNPLGEFDASKIGTGEGAQSYGYGIYTAENPAVATEYKLAEATYKRMQGGLTNKQEFVSDMLSQGRPEMSILDLYAQKYGGSFDDAMKDLIDVKEIYKKSGNLYKVDLPDEKIAAMLDFDKPMAEQRNLIEKMRKALIGEGSPLSNVQQFELNDFLSDKVRMRNLSPQSIVDLNNPKIVKRLSEAGIPGIKYFDEGSRAAGQGTRNFVTFPGSEKSMTILERNAEKSAK